MADSKDLQEAADAIHRVRDLAAVLRHKELGEPLRQAEEWARQKYQKVREGRDEPQPGKHRDDTTDRM
jgi:hypothetical protein